jgi:hypothetical protein
MINMNRRIVLFTLFSTFLLLALVMAASAQTRTVGVSVGNKFRYRATVGWSSNDTSATPDFYLGDANNTDWGEFTVAGISGTNITGQTITHYKNGTETTMSGWIDVNTGAGNATMIFISANLAAGDSLYTSSYNNWFINDTAPRTYLSGVRDTNHIDVTGLSGTVSSHYNVYWDKSTGVLVDQLRVITNQTGTYTTTASLDVQIISSDVWIVPEFPTWTPALLMLIALTSATMVIARQKQPKRPLR